MIQKTRATWWLCVGGCGLAVGVIVVFVFLRANGSNSLTTLTSDSPAPVSGMVVSEANAPTKAPPEVATSMEPALPPLDFPPGSVEEACGLNEFPAYWNGEEDVLQDWNWAVVPTNEKGEWLVLESEECQVALENHINALNPYIFLWGEELYQSRVTAFIVLEKPLTFERIFADPIGDFSRVQDALSRPECLLTGDETNWELKETCHAEALLNFALVNRFCFGEGIDRRVTSAWDDNPTPEEDRFYWKQRLEEEWLKKKCKTVDPTLKLTEYWEPDQMLSYFHDQESPGDDFLAQWAQVQAGLIELSARLGDDTAGVTRGFRRFRFIEEGYKYGRYSWLLTSAEWKNFVSKRQPSTDRFLRTFKMLVTVGARRPDPRDEIEIDWDRVARHLCEPPYYRENKWLYHDKKIPELKSCKEIVHELRQRDIKFAPLLNTLDKFEQVALELGVYE